MRIRQYMSLFGIASIIASTVVGAGPANASDWHKSSQLTVNQMEERVLRRERKLAEHQLQQEQDKHQYLSATYEYSPEFSPTPTPAPVQSAGLVSHIKQII